jgi:hypothetical protein
MALFEAVVAMSLSAQAYLVREQASDEAFWRAEMTSPKSLYLVVNEIPAESPSDPDNYCKSESGEVDCGYQRKEFCKIAIRDARSPNAYCFRK